MQSFDTTLREARRLIAKAYIEGRELKRLFEKAKTGAAVQ